MMQRGGPPPEGAARAEAAAVCEGWGRGGVCDAGGASVGGARYRDGRSDGWATKVATRHGAHGGGDGQGHGARERPGGGRRGGRGARSGGRRWQLWRGGGRARGRRRNRVWVVVACGDARLETAAARARWGVRWRAQWTLCRCDRAIDGGVGWRASSGVRRVRASVLYGSSSSRPTSVVVGRVHAKRRTTRGAGRQRAPAGATRATNRGSTRGSVPPRRHCGLGVGTRQHSRPSSDGRRRGRGPWPATPSLPNPCYTAAPTRASSAPRTPAPLRDGAQRAASRRPPPQMPRSGRSRNAAGGPGRGRAAAQQVPWEDTTILAAVGARRGRRTLGCGQRRRRRRGRAVAGRRWEGGCGGGGQREPRTEPRRTASRGAPRGHDEPRCGAGEADVDVWRVRGA